MKIKNDGDKTKPLKKSLKTPKEKSKNSLNTIEKLTKINKNKPIILMPETINKIQAIIKESVPTISTKIQKQSPPKLPEKIEGDEENGLRKEVDLSNDIRIKSSLRHLNKSI